MTWVTDPEEIARINETVSFRRVSFVDYFVASIQKAAVTIEQRGQRLGVRPAAVDHSGREFFGGAAPEGGVSWDFDAGYPVVVIDGSQVETLSVEQFQREQASEGTYVVCVVHFPGVRAAVELEADDLTVTHRGTSSGDTAGRAPVAGDVKRTDTAADVDQSGASS